MNDRFIRQTVLKEFGIKSQEILSNSRVLVVGCGGLGIPVIQYLNAMGVGTLGVIDGDTVDLTNLHRQVIFDENDIGKSKVNSAIAKLKIQNSRTKLKGYNFFINNKNALEIISNYDYIVDASDNFSTRYLINDSCIILDKPFVYGALHGFEGHISVFNYNSGPSYRCLYPNMPSALEIPNCNDHGVLGVLPGIIGAFQALETVKVITGVGIVLSGKIQIFNGLNNTFYNLKIKKNKLNFSIKALDGDYDLKCDIHTDSISNIKIDELIKNEKIQIIDVRSINEYKSFYLKNSINIPLQKIEIEFSKINFKRKVYFVCQSGVRSLKAIQVLKPKYPKADLINIIGGINKLSKYAVTC